MLTRRSFLRSAAGLFVAAAAAPVVEPVRKLWAVSRDAPVPERGPLAEIAQHGFFGISASSYQMWRAGVRVESHPWLVERTDAETTQKLLEHINEHADLWRQFKVTVHG